ncbi:MAG: glycoside hydrolase family 2 [Kiritimatiellae bacterium]|nr:glycoside hydrolase family 2 [Kiritimatiellia bacterium]
MKTLKTALMAFAVLGMAHAFSAIPLPEHPRPDWERSEWVNLNGEWDFAFEAKGTPVDAPARPAQFDQKIVVPFGWAAPLSGVKGEGDSAWYRREVEIPADWKSPRFFLVVGACDWQTDVFVNGKFVDRHQGGYVPFEVELTPFAKKGEKATVELRVWDAPSSVANKDWRLYGKQGYGNARGIWQTVYLEGRGDSYIESVRFEPYFATSLCEDHVFVSVTLGAPAKAPLDVTIAFKPEDGGAKGVVSFGVGEMYKELDIPIKDVKVWDLDNPYLYEVTVKAGDDEVSTYFGFREIDVDNNPNGHPYVTLNGKPVYLQLTLDQSYHPEGFYTFPTDEFMKNEILISKKLGLTGNRVHIKAEIPRKLYWADKLGLLIMADVPNWWGNASETAFREHWACFEGMLKRDFNHPSVFAWVLFNETWGLFSEGHVYSDATKRRVADVWRRAKDADPTRIIEDNSPCNNDHVVTDINTWHSYLPGWKWESTLDEFCSKTFPGSNWNYKGGFVQRNWEPMMNSECGNVWGYDGSTGDCDLTWDYHMMINAFRRHMKCAGWLYTEHHDVINEWNGYVRFDRTEKEFGIEELFPGMTFRDFHADAYMPLDTELCREFKAGETYIVPVDISLTTDRYAGKKLSLGYSLRYIDGEGRVVQDDGAPTRRIRYDEPASAWQEKGGVRSFAARLPDCDACGTVNVTLYADDEPIARNFTCFVTRKGEVSDVRPVRGEWSLKQWDVMDGKKFCGAGTGYFEYEFDAPKGECVFRAEVSSKRLNAKDFKKDVSSSSDIDYMLGGLASRSQNPNSYPQTSAVHKFPGTVKVYANGTLVATVDLPDDPADHRGILSWFSQERAKDGKDRLCEAGSYGYLVEAKIPAEVAAASKDGKMTIRLAAEKTGLAVYGPRFGRMPFAPHLRF